MEDIENQMGLFEIPKKVVIGKTADEAKLNRETQPIATEIGPETKVKLARREIRSTPSSKRAAATKSTKAIKKPALKAVSGLVPEGDVRLTANIRQDLHLRLKIAAAHQRTTIGEIIEDLIARYIKI